MLIGYIQSYTIDRKISTWFPQIPGNGNILGIDQFIGEPAYLYKGIGTLFIKEFVDMCMMKDKNLTIIVDPEPTNTAAIKCYEKVGFKKLGTYQAPWGPALVMMYQAKQR